MQTPTKWGLVYRIAAQTAGLLLLTYFLGLVAYKYSQGSASDVSEMLKATLWPAFALIALIVLRAPIVALLEEISRRAGKVSVFDIEVELRDAQATPLVVPAINELKRGQAITVGDSGNMIFTQLQGQSSGDYLLVDLGRGDEWITSRLYLVAALFPRMRGVRCIVFVAQDGERRGQFVGTAMAETVRWRLAQAYPWLEVALMEAMRGAIPGSGATHPVAAPVILSGTGAIDPMQATFMARTFILSLQQPVPPPTPSEWVQVSDAPLAWERATWLTTQTLQQLLGGDLNKASVSEIGRASNVEVVRQILSRSGPYVAGVTDGTFNELIDRNSVLEELARRTLRP